MSTKHIVIIASVILFVLCVLAGGIVVWQGPTLAANLGLGGPTATFTPVPNIVRTPIPTSVPPSATTLATASQVAVATTTTPPILPSQTLIPNPSPTPSPHPPLSTEQQLLQAILPARDQRQLVLRFAEQDQEIPEVVHETAPQRNVGDQDQFWITDNQQTPPRQFETTATLHYITAHSYWWVAEDSTVNEEALKRSAERFEHKTYPTNRTFFGSEWSPGVDNDVRVHIFMGDVPGVAGYFSASNEYSQLAEPYSNEREMFFINLRAISPGNDHFDGVLAHEFQHMIHWYQDRNEDTWVNEGLSELATFVNGYGSSNFIGAFTSTPDTQLTGWADSPGASAANYGGSFLFMAYFLQRYDEAMMQAVIAHPANGIAGFDMVLAENGYEERFEQIFADFLVANIVQDPGINEGIWGYRDFSPGPSTISKLYRVYPQSEQATVYQYGADYIELTGFGDATIEFTGSTQVQVVQNQPHSGQFQWYSHRGDDSNPRLTRTFDLSEVDTATLNYWLWYDIETDWDYGYVEVSTDGGQRWQILETPHTATTNPTGNAYGPGYTGSSEGWVQESLDLSPYAGQEIQIRFEYVTDDAVNRSGWTIDDISIPEIGFQDDIELGENGWQAEGFVRIDNVLPQKFLVQLIEFGDEIEVTQFPLDETNQGSLTVIGLGDRLGRAVLVISGLAPVTSQPASYEYNVTLVE